MDKNISNLKEKTLKSKKIAKTTKKDETPLKHIKPPNQMWISVFVASELGGVTTKTIRRAIQGKKIKYKITNNKYQLLLESVITYLYSNKKLLNKLKYYGIGQYIKKWEK